MFRKILVANRGEIAIRAFRAAYELGARTVAVFPYEDRGSLHRQKADESYVIGEPGHPVRAYLDVDEIIRVALESRRGCDLPGLRIPLRESGARGTAAENGITFIGPPSTALEMAGNKVTAKHHAIAAGVPVLRSTEASEDVDALVAQAADIGFPIFVKAVAGGGGRGMRRVESPTSLPPAIAEAMREAGAAFGDARVFLEQAVVRPRHIEVQILADATGHTVHLFERDCSVQRRHQKVIEIAPAPNLDRRAARRAPPRRGRLRRVDRLRQRRHRRVPRRHGGRARRRARLHRDEPPHPGRAHGHRRGDRRRPRAVADPHRRGRDARRPRARPGAASCCAAPPCSAASPRRTRRRASAPTPAASRRTARRAAPASASTAARPPRARRSARTSTRCSRS